MKSKYEEAVTQMIEDSQQFLMPIIRYYMWGFELLGATLLIYVFYHIGRLSNRDPTKDKIDKLNSVEQNKEKLTAKENASLNRIKKIKWLLTFLFFVILALNVALYAFPAQSKLLLIKANLTPLNNLTQKAVLSAVCFTVALVVWKLIKTYENYIQKSTEQRIKNLEIESVSDFNQLFQILGEQTTIKIKNKICKDLLLKLNREGSQNRCGKQKCIEQRRLLFDSYAIDNNFLQKIMSFGWCDSCLTKKKIGQIKLMSAQPVKVYKDEKEEVEDKTKIIYDETLKIATYLDQICQNFCNVKFWKMSRSEGMKMKSEKQTNKQRQQAIAVTVKK